jgi:hypothetical protein
MFPESQRVFIGIQHKNPDFIFGNAGFLQIFQAFAYQFVGDSFFSEFLFNRQVMEKTPAAVLAAFQGSNYLVFTYRDEI